MNRAVGWLSQTHNQYVEAALFQRKNLLRDKCFRKPGVTLQHKSDAN
jgi:hypothetical protein